MYSERTIPHTLIVWHLWSTIDKCLHVESVWPCRISPILNHINKLFDTVQVSWNKFWQVQLERCYDIHYLYCSQFTLYIHCFRISFLVYPKIFEITLQRAQPDQYIIGYTNVSMLTWQILKIFSLLGTTKYKAGALLIASLPEWSNLWITNTVQNI